MYSSVLPCFHNHCPARSVLGIINHAGCMAEHLTLPASNLVLVPDSLTDAQAAFCEPLAAACRILEQGLLQQQQGSSQQVAVVGEYWVGAAIGFVATQQQGKNGKETLVC